MGLSLLSPCTEHVDSYAAVLFCVSLCEGSKRDNFEALQMTKAIW